MSLYNLAFKLKSCPRSIAVAFCFIIYLISITRSLQFPDGYASGIMLLDYSLGFINRALIGTLIFPFVQPDNPGMTADVIRWVGVIMLVVFSGVLLDIIWKLISDTEDSFYLSAPVLIVFLSSPFIVVMGDLLGYYDYFIFCLMAISIPVVLKTEGTKQTVMLMAILTLAVMIHEIALLFNLPLILAMLFYNYFSNADIKEGSKGILVNIFVFVKQYFWIWLPPVVLYVILSHNQRDVNLHELKEYIASFNLGYYSAFSTDFMDSYIGWNGFETLLDRFLHKQANYQILPSLLLFILVIILLTYQKIKKIPLVILLLLLVSSEISHAVVWDTPRFKSFLIATNFLFIVFLLLHKNVRKPVGRLIVIISFLALAVTIFHFYNDFELTFQPDRSGVLNII